MQLGLTVAELEQAMTIREFARWNDFFQDRADDAADAADPAVDPATLTEQQIEQVFGGKFS